jgi:hypothetical protein
LFEQRLSNKLHNSLVIKNESQTKQSIKQTRDALPSLIPLASVAARNKKAALPLAPSQSCTPTLPMPISGLLTSVFGSKEKKPILEEYVSKFGSGYQELIITKKKGKLDNKPSLQSLASSQQCMKPSIDKYYQRKVLTIYNVITIVIQKLHGLLQEQAVKHTSVEYQLCKDKNTQAPMMASDRLLFVMQAAFES